MMMKKKETKKEKKKKEKKKKEKKKKNVGLRPCGLFCVHFGMHIGVIRAQIIFKHSC